MHVKIKLTCHVALRPWNNIGLGEHGWHHVDTPSSVHMNAYVCEMVTVAIFASSADISYGDILTSPPEELQLSRKIIFFPSQVSVQTFNVKRLNVGT